MEFLVANGMKMQYFGDKFNKMFIANFSKTSSKDYKFQLP
jgi:hypothetical protein